MTYTWNGIMYVCMHTYIHTWMDMLACTHSGGLTQFTILCLESVSPNQHLFPLLSWFGRVPRTPWLVTTSLHCPIHQHPPCISVRSGPYNAISHIGVCPALFQHDLQRTNHTGNHPSPNKVAFWQITY